MGLEFSSTPRLSDTDLHPPSFDVEEYESVDREWDGFSVNAPTPVLARQKQKHLGRDLKHICARTHTLFNLDNMWS